MELDKPTRDGEKVVHLLTNLPVKDANARQVGTALPRALDH